MSLTKCVLRCSFLHTLDLRAGFLHDNIEPRPRQGIEIPSCLALLRNLQNAFTMVHCGLRVDQDRWQGAEQEPANARELSSHQILNTKSLVGKKFTRATAYKLPGIVERTACKLRVNSPLVTDRCCEDFYIQDITPGTHHTLKGRFFSVQDALGCQKDSRFHLMSHKLQNTFPRSHSRYR